MPLVVQDGFTRFLIGIRYHGGYFSGWSPNPGTKHPTIMDAVSKALTKFVGENNYTNLKVSSRTDSGVHALRNRFCVDITRNKVNMPRSSSSSEKVFDPVLLPRDIQNALNHFLQSNNNGKIYITDVEEKPNDFDCRADATSRTYMYRILCPSEKSSFSIMNNQRDSRMLRQRDKDLSCTSSEIYDIEEALMFQSDYAWVLKYPLDVHRMQMASEVFIGEHDFNAFRSSSCVSKVPNRFVMKCEVTRAVLPPGSTQLLYVSVVVFVHISVYHGIYYYYYHCYIYICMYRMMPS